MQELKLIDAINFAYDTVMMDPLFLDSELTPEDAETIVHDIIIGNFPKCYEKLKDDMIKMLKDRS
jgi:hypothetical protein